MTEILSSSLLSSICSCPTRRGRFRIAPRSKPKPPHLFTYSSLPLPTLSFDNIPATYGSSDGWMNEWICWWYASLYVQDIYMGMGWSPCTDMDWNRDNIERTVNTEFVMISGGSASICDSRGLSSAQCVTRTTYRAQLYPPASSLL